MQIFTLGKKPEGKLEYIPREILTESVPGQLYEIHIRTQSLLGRGGPDKETIASILIKELPERFNGLIIHWIEINDEMIKVSITGSPFAWAALFLALPQILAVIGVTVLMIGVYLLWTHVPGYVVGLIVIGALLIFVGPKITDLWKR